MDELEMRLRARLRDPDITVPDSVDDAILAAGRDGARAFRRRQRLRVLRLASALAAALVLAAWLGVRLFGSGGDRFDVVDAWRVAAGLERDETRFDLNHDGALDRADAELMLTRIVALEPRRRS